MAAVTSWGFSWAVLLPLDTKKYNTTPPTIRMIGSEISPSVLLLSILEAEPNILSPSFVILLTTLDFPTVEAAPPVQLAADERPDPVVFAALLKPPPTVLVAEDNPLPILLSQPIFFMFARVHGFTIRSMHKNM